MKLGLIIMTFLSSLFGAKAQETDTMKIYGPLQFKEAVADGNVQLVDVRTEKEYNEGAIANAENIDYFKQDTFKAQFEKFNKDEPLYLYCRSGNRSQKAATILQQMGFMQIIDLEGGYMGWPYKN